MIELAWAAGLFDGEGSSYYNESSRSLQIRISQNYDPEVLERFRAAVGVGKVYGPYGGERMAFQYVAAGQAAIIAMEQIGLFLSGPKRLQWELATEMWEARPGERRFKDNLPP